MTYQVERTALFIDGPNLHGMMRSLGWDIDYDLLLRYFAGVGTLVRPYYFTTHRDDGDDPVRRLTQYLSHHGYTVVTKTAKTMNDGTVLRSGMQVEVAVTMLRLAENIDHLVLFSGDGDYRMLVQDLQDQGRRVSVAGTIRGSGKVMSEELRRQADNFIELEDLRGQISRQPPRQEA